ncbi:MULTISPECIES: aminoglycoside phosphotransferase family protein [unclassified Streptomyces]|uniref:aminoglycoside phosphotransferase family protein n=1 Tax=unclassified Streptomyces TaxID=2593676 RepID=UPI001CBD88D0|nr:MULTISPECIES: aminoglycoside phosphotransferase family protein [unclassified Streptomyces]WPO72156.1 aminoglycoside phosphotransferase family protein [Streptomyces sp. KN37]
MNTSHGPDAELIRALLKDQHPDLADLDIHPPIRGWDNELWRLGGELALRLPRTERAPTLIRKEHRWLPELAVQLPLPVPTPLRLGEPSVLFPQPWTIVKWLRGEPADRTPLSPARGDHAADTLAVFLRALHQPAPADAPSNPYRTAPLDTLTEAFERQVREFADDVPPGVRAVWEDSVAAPGPQGPPVWLHCDLHPANAVVTDDALSGVLDFGELCAGDPAVDLAAAWMLLPNGRAPRFFTAYANADDAMVRRARGRAILHSLALIGIGRAGDRGLPGGKVTWGHAGRAALSRVVADG